MRLTLSAPDAWGRNVICSDVNGDALSELELLMNLLCYQGVSARAWLSAGSSAKRVALVRDGVWRVP